MADLLTIAETAERLRVSARTVEREIAAGCMGQAWDRQIARLSAATLYERTVLTI